MWFLNRSIGVNLRKYPIAGKVYNPDSLFVGASFAREIGRKSRERSSLLQKICHQWGHTPQQLSRERSSFLQDETYNYFNNSP